MSLLRLRKETPLDTMLGCVSKLVLKAIYQKLIGLDSLPAEKNKKSELKKLIKSSGAPDDTLLLYLYGAEAHIPFRHNHLTRWQGNFTKLAGSVSSMEALSFDSASVHGISNLKCCFTSIDQDRVIISFEHDAKSTIWQWKDGGRFPKDVVLDYTRI